MDVAVERPAPPVKEEKKPETMEIRSSPPIVFESFPSTQRVDPTTNKDAKKLEATKAEMGEVREENERLKSLLSHIVRDYQSLQMHFHDAVKVKQQEQQQAGAADKQLTSAALAEADVPPAATAAAADDLVSLSLGSGCGYARRKARAAHERTSSSSSGTETDQDDQLSLGLSSRRSNDGDDRQQASRPSAAPLLNLSSDSSADDAAEPRHHLPAAACPPASKVRKSPGAGVDGGADDEVLQQQAKKARVSVRVKCDTPTMNDGCQWRKYGQKISKGNPCPRAYYRCTVAPSCPVRKQVQRCSDDMSILITTYEGTHSHPLPPAAAAMASTTSAAASMLLAGPSSSSSSHLPFATAGLLGPTTISTIASCPTVTLDLTAPHSLMQQQYASPYASPYESKALPAAWSSGYHLAPYGGGLPYYGKSSLPAMGQHFGLGMAAAARPEHLYGAAHPSSYLQRTSSGGVQHGGPAPAVTDTIAKAITSDPSFQSVLAAAITSYMGRGAGAAAQK